MPASPAAGYHCPTCCSRVYRHGATTYHSAAPCPFPPWPFQELARPSPGLPHAPCRTRLQNRLLMFTLHRMLLFRPLPTPYAQGPARPRPRYMPYTTAAQVVYTHVDSVLPTPAHRDQHARARGYTFYSNEFTVHGGLDTTPLPPYVSGPGAGAGPAAAGGPGGSKKGATPASTGSREQAAAAPRGDGKAQAPAPGQRALLMAAATSSSTGSGGGGSSGSGVGSRSNSKGGTAGTGGGGSGGSGGGGSVSKSGGGGGKEAAPPPLHASAHLCGTFLNVVMLREPIRRLESHLRWIMKVRVSLCGRGKGAGSVVLGVRG